MLCIPQLSLRWAGELDYRIAEFIIQLQKDVLALYNACNRNNIRYKSERMEKEGLTINVVVSAGCTDLLAQLKGVKDKMNGPQLTAVIIVWLILSYGNQAFSTWQQHIEKIEKKALALEIAEVFERVEHANRTSMISLAGGVYKEGFILSLNAPRDGAMSYAEAVQKSIDVVEAMNEED